LISQHVLKSSIHCLAETQIIVLLLVDPMTWQHVNGERSSCQSPALDAETCFYFVDWCTRRIVFKYSHARIRRIHAFLRLLNAHPAFRLSAPGLLLPMPSTNHSNTVPPATGSNTGKNGANTLVISHPSVYVVLNRDHELRDLEERAHIHSKCII
jgi:hypothetical protein